MKNLQKYVLQQTELLCYRHIPQPDIYSVTHRNLLRQCAIPATTVFTGARWRLHLRVTVQVVFKLEADKAETHERITKCITQVAP